MAAVSLKDLMNPLSKISYYAEESNKKLDKISSSLDNFISISTKTVSQLSGSLQKIITENSRISGKILNSLTSNNTILSSILTEIKSKNKVQEVKVEIFGNSTFVKDFDKFLENFVGVLHKYEKVKPDVAKNFIKTIDDILFKMSAYEKLDIEKIDKISASIKNFKSSVIGYATSMSLVALLSPGMIIGSAAFGLSLKLLSYGLSAIDDKDFDKIKDLNLKLAFGIVAFTGSMIFVYHYAKEIILGTLAFGLSLKLLSTILGLGIFLTFKFDAIIELSKNVFKYMLTMAATAILSPLVLLGAATFGLSVRIISSLMSGELLNLAKRGVSIFIFNMMADNILKYSLTMAMTGLLSPLVILGATAFGLSAKIMFALMNNIGPNNIVKYLTNILMIKTIGDVVFKYSLGMATTGLLAPLVFIGAATFALSTKVLFAILGNVTGKNLAQSVNLYLISQSVLKYTIGLSISSLLAPLVLIGAAGLSLSMILLSKGLNAIKTDYIKSAGSLILISLSVAGYSVAMAYAASVLYNNYEGVLITLGLVGLSAVIFGIIGYAKAAKNIIKGSIAIAALSGGLALFGLGYGLYADRVKGITFKELGIQLAILTGVTVVVGLLGFIGGIATGGAGIASIALGAISLALVGGGLAVFGFGYNKFRESVSGTTLEEISIQGRLLFNLGKNLAFIGLLSPLLILSSLSLATIGGSLMILAKGLSEFKKINWTQADSINLNTTLLGITSGFGGGKTEGGLMNKFIGFIKGGIDSASMMTAAVGYATIGKSLTVLSQGLKSFKSIKWTESDSLVLASALSSISNVFSNIGGTVIKKSKNPILKWIDNLINPNEIELGIKSVKRVGGVLVSITDGLIKFNELVEQKIDFTDFSNNLKLVLTSIQSAFAAIGSEGKVNADGLWGAFGFKQNVVKAGIKSVKGVGKELIDIIKGIESFNNLTKKNINFNDLTSSLKLVLTSIQSAFAAIGSEGKVNADGLWGAFGFKQNVVKAGIKSVKGVGKELSRIVTGLKFFISDELKGVSFDKGGPLHSNILGALGLVQSAFASIGSEGKVNANGLWGMLGFKKNVVKAGIKSVQGVGEELSGITTGLKSFISDDLKGIDFRKNGSLHQSIKGTLTIVIGAFSALGSGKPNSYWGKDLMFDTLSIQRGINLTKNSFENLSSIAKSLMDFKNIGNPTIVTDSISSMLNSVSNLFADVYRNNDTFDDNLTKFTNFINNLSDRSKRGDINRIAKDIEKVAKSINLVDVEKIDKFSDFFRAMESFSLSPTNQAIATLSDQVKEIVDLLNNNQSNTQSQQVQPTFAQPQQTVTQQIDMTKLENIMIKIEDALENLNSTMGSLPGAISQIELKQNPF